MGFFRRGRSTDQPVAAQSAVPDPLAAGDQGSTKPLPGVTLAGVALPGVTLHYQAWGLPNAERVALLVPGLTASHKTWARLGPHLAAQGHYVIAPDLRGRGESGKPAHGYGVGIHAADLVALLDALGLSGADIVGHSLGAVIAMYVGALYPARARKLVLVDTGGNIPEDTAQAIAASVSRLGMSYPSLDTYLGLMRQLPMITEWNELWEDYFRYDAEVRADGTVVSRVPKAAIEEEWLALALTRSEALPGLVRQPTLLVRATVGLLGADRGFILPRAEAERVRNVIPGCRLVEIEGTNHYTIVTVPEFMDAVGAFLAG